MTQRDGMFISFEGIDGAGKSTQVASLAASLRAAGHDVLTVRPQDTALGETARRIVLQHQVGDGVDPWAEALLFFAGRAQLLRTMILPGLERGQVVIADRYTDSTLAYQGGGRGLATDELLRIHRVACADVWPALTLYLDVPVAVAAGRRRAEQLPLDRIERAPEAFHVAVRAAFELLAERHPERIVRVSAARPPAEVAKDILEIALQRLARLVPHTGRSTAAV